MNIEAEIHNYISNQAEKKQQDMNALHQMILEISTGCKLWFLDGKNSENKVVSNPNIGYGTFKKHYANGSSMDFYQIGMSANTSGISIYIMGLQDKLYLKNTYAETLGKASITGYCIKFKKLEDINLEVLRAAITDGFLA